MRQLAGSLNRGWLAVIGLVLLLAGLIGVLATTGALTQLLASTGTGWTAPPGGSPVLDTDAAGGLVSQPVAVVAIALVGVILALLGLAWLLAQIPRTNAARPYRVNDDATTGLTVCPPDVLAAAVADDVASYPGVTGATAVFRGTARAPELTLRVSADDRTDLRALVSAIRTDAVRNVETALDAPVTRLAVQLDIDRGKRTTSSVTL